MATQPSPAPQHHQDVTGPCAHPWPTTDPRGDRQAGLVRARGQLGKGNPHISRGHGATRERTDGPKVAGWMGAGRHQTLGGLARALVPIPAPQPSAGHPI